ncbi:hypothetical protein JW935_23185 [candidate division KSB1 bacterium]|nr:hypothetical protein [candidate division KSB1 bacterium]
MDISIDAGSSLDDFIQRIKKQDRVDEKYIIYNKMIPVLFGLFAITIIMILNPLKTVLLLSGMFLIFLGLFCALMRLLKDYKNISKESYDLSLLAYLKQKEERLKSWRSTSAKQQWTYIVFVSGLVLMIISHTGMWRKFGTENVILFLAGYLIILFISWVLGEYYYRKRHKKLHLPLLKTISEQINEILDRQNSTD